MNKSIINKFLIFVTIFAFLCMPCCVNKVSFAGNEDKLKLSSKSALLVDYESGYVVFEKNSNERLPIASMTKIASLSVILSYLEKGVIKENDFVVVSENASSVGGSSAFLDAGAKYKVSELIKSIIIASANDSTVALAEFVAGSEDLFVDKMNKLCGELKLTDTHFENSTGLPSENHYSTACDLVKIYKTICEKPIYKKYSKVWMDDFIHPSGRKTGLVNTNRLIKTYDGIDGGKTGYTDKAKFCLTASASRGDTRLIGVVIGANDSKIRFSEMSKLFNYGFSNYENKLIIDKDTPVALHKFKNAKNSISIYPEKNVQRFHLKADAENFSTDFQISELRAPLKKDDVVGKMFVFDENNMVVDEVNLVAGENCEVVGFKEMFTKMIRSW